VCVFHFLLRLRLIIMPGEYIKGRKRTFSMEYEDEEGDSGLRLLRKSGIPLLYIIAFCANIVGIICFAMLNKYWSNLANPMCYLYSQTASPAIIYKFGGALSNCTWISYGAIPSTILALGCAIAYMFGVFGDPVDREEEKSMISYTRWILLVMVVATILQLAVCATFAEGLRVTCTNMSLNSVNGIAETCLDRINRRVMQYNLPIKSSTMIIAGQIGLWSGLAALTFLVICHIISYSRMQ